MTNKQKRVNNPLYRTLTFFLFAVAFSNIIGNFIGLTSSYTFYHYGFSTTLIVSRLIEDAIMSFTWRIIVLGLVTLVSSVIFYVIYSLSTRYISALVIGVVLYILDYALLFSQYMIEPASFMATMHAIHLVVLAFILTCSVGLLISLPPRRNKYDFA